MFTYVIVASVLIVLGLTAFVPRFRSWMQWLYKKTLLVLFGLLLVIYRLVVGLTILVLLVGFGLVWCLGRIFVWIGDRVLPYLADTDARNEKHVARLFTKALNRL